MSRFDRARFPSTAQFRPEDEKACSSGANGLYAFLHESRRELGGSAYWRKENLFKAAEANEACVTLHYCNSSMSLLAIRPQERKILAYKALKILRPVRRS